MTKQSNDSNFDQLLLDAIDEGLSGLGEAGKTSIYIHLEDLFNIRKQEIPTKIDDFSNAMNRIFGIGAQQIEILIMKKFHEKVEINKLEDPIRLFPNLTLTKYVELMRTHYKDEEKIIDSDAWADVCEKNKQRLKRT